MSRKLLETVLGIQVSGGGSRDAGWWAPRSFQAPWTSQAAVLDGPFRTSITVSHRGLPLPVRLAVSVPGAGPLLAAPAPVDRLATRAGRAAGRTRRQQAEAAHPSEPEGGPWPGPPPADSTSRPGWHRHDARDHRLAHRAGPPTTSVRSRRPPTLVRLRCGGQWPSADRPLRSNASSTWSEIPAALSDLSPMGVSGYAMSSISINTTRQCLPVTARRLPRG